MAYTKVFAVRRRLDKSVSYVANEIKTGLDGMIEYAVDINKTEQRLFESALNCQSPQSAFGEMMETKRRWGKTGGVLAYHFIQSFAPGETTPEQAHAIGLEFAQQLFGERFEVVLGTHLDKAHLHNHIIINSVSFTDGLKYHSSPDSYYNNVRTVSDTLCRKENLSVIVPKGHSKHYAEWKAEQEGKPTIRSRICEDIDGIISDAYTYSSFLMLLEKRGYTIKQGENRKYIAVKPPGAQRFIRLDSLGDGYTEAAILKRLSGQRQVKGGQSLSYCTQAQKHYRLRGKLESHPRKKITGFLALYFRYVYLLRGLKGKKALRSRSFVFWEEGTRLQRYQEQFKYLLTRQIATEAELTHQIQVLEWDIGLLSEERRPLYLERRKSDSEEIKARLSEEIDRYTADLGQKRRELALCRRIQEDIPRVKEMMGKAQAEQKNELKKEEKRNEQQRRCR